MKWSGSFQCLVRKLKPVYQFGPSLEYKGSVLLLVLDQVVERKSTVYTYYRRF